MTGRDRIIRSEQLFSRKSRMLAMQIISLSIYIIPRFLVFPQIRDVVCLSDEK